MAGSRLDSSSKASGQIAVPMIVSGLEPDALKALGTVAGVPENYGADILIVERGIKVGIQRKQFPGDFLSSLADGRLYEQLHALQELDHAFLLIEGFGRWTLEGELVHDTFTHFTKKQYHGLIASVQMEFGIAVMQVRDLGETCIYLVHLEEWLQKETHNSLRTRPGPPRTAWGTRDNRAFGLHFLQSFPGVGVELAGRIYDHFGGVPVDWAVADWKALTVVPGIGKEKAQRIWKVLERKQNGIGKSSNNRPQGRDRDDPVRRPRRIQKSKRG